MGDEQELRWGHHPPVQPLRLSVVEWRKGGGFIAETADRLPLGRSEKSESFHRRVGRPGGKPISVSSP